MQLTRYTDYSLRVLIYLGLNKNNIVTIDEINDFYQISRNHLVKIVHNLSIKGFVITTRGKHGGIQLARDPAMITIGEVVRQMEPHFNIVECLSRGKGSCRVAPICSLKSVLNDALEQFLSHLDEHTLADATRRSVTLESLNKLSRSLPHNNRH